MSKKRKTKERAFRQTMRLLLTETAPEHRKSLKRLIRSIRSGKRDLRVS